MSAATKRKHVFQEFNDMTLPTDSQIIVRIVAARGHNLFEIVSPNGEQYIVSMPTKFRKNIFVKRGDYIVAEPIKEGKKVKGEIVKILTKDHIKWYREQNCWPLEFDEVLKRNGDTIKTNHTICDDEELFVNTNRHHLIQQTDDSDSDSTSDDTDSDSDSISDDYSHSNSTSNSVHKNSDSQIVLSTEIQILPSKISSKKK